MSTKRSIRLKEFLPNTRFIRVPTEDYYKKNPLLEENKFYYLHTDEDGFIYNHINNDYEKDLIILGDSSVENLFVETTSRFTSILEEKLIKFGLDYNLKNGGCSGASLLHILNNINNKIIKKEKPVIFLFIPSNESSITNLKNHYWNEDKLNSNLVGEENSTIFNKNKGETFSFEKVLKIIIQVCKISNINLHVFDIITLKEKNIYKTINQQAEKICMENNIFFHKLHDNLCNNSFFYDDLHLNKNGSNALANILFNLCKEILEPTKTNSYLFSSIFFKKNIKIIEKELTLDKISGLSNKININSNAKDQPKSTGVIISFDEEVNENINIGICNKIRSKYDTHLVFDEKTKKIVLAKKIIDQYFPIHLFNECLFFIKENDIIFINELTTQTCLYSKKESKKNYNINKENNYIYITIGEKYLSASNLMILKEAEQLRSCEKFYYL